jgi:hypothetical protein
MIPQILAERRQVHVPPLAVAAHSGRSWYSTDALGVGHNPGREIPALGAQQTDHLARRQPIDNTAIGGCAA